MEMEDKDLCKRALDHEISLLIPGPKSGEGESQEHAATKVI